MYWTEPFDTDCLLMFVHVSLQGDS